MATTWTENNHDLAIAHVDLRGVITLGLSAALPMAGYFAADMLGDALGIMPVVTPPMGLPEWSVAAAMMLTLPMWGVARWLVGQRGPEGRRTSRWIVALIAGVILLPFALSLANPFMTGLLPMLVLLTGVVAAMRASALSGAAALLLAPGLVWFGLGSLIGFTTMAGGWSPPFALVDHNKH
ncbi:MAG: hypothetical protein JWR51_261 [Devosia sp.]|uniref:hypothetical protein n=1 Tax=Devosia sp. TaxID=1871048 RepID=UPI002633524E|nr:hypothetical protein [Devosia sp.]MDB5527158.1 hypothetical protein [Devosia sp.]